MSKYCIYLRKSRADSESEQDKEIDTLIRHENILLELARKQNLNIVEIYREVVSGDSISSRPEMQRLLNAVEHKEYTGVVTIDIDRLARGATIDQGIIAQAFKYSNTKIITPIKIYDPNNEFDEEYFEFGLFMARREYKIINRRLIRGRQISAQEGKFLGSIPPYGYDKIKLDKQKGYSLKPNIEQAETVRLIFDLFVNKSLGSTIIAKKLNELEQKSENKKIWLPTTIRDVLKNPVYIGNIRINSKPTKKITKNGEIKTTRVRDNNCVVVKGLHEPIIDLKLWEKSQKNLLENNPAKVKKGFELKNPLAGLVYCGKCGKSVIRRSDQRGFETIICQTINCDNAACKLEVLENKIVEALEKWTENYKLRFPETKENKNETNAKIFKNINSKLKELEEQSKNIYDLLERGVYDISKFLERQKIIAEKIQSVEKEKEEFETSILQKEKKSDKNNLSLKIKKVMTLYSKLNSPKQKNELLKQIIEKVIYVRESSGRWVDSGNFEIELYPKI